MYINKAVLKLTITKNQKQIRSQITGLYIIRRGFL